MLVKEQKNLNIFPSNSLIIFKILRAVYFKKAMFMIKLRRPIKIPEKLSEVDFFIEIDRNFKSHERFKDGSTILHHHTVLYI